MKDYRHYSTSEPERAKFISSNFRHPLFKNIELALNILDYQNSISDMPDSVFKTCDLKDGEYDLFTVCELIVANKDNSEYISGLKEILQVAKDNQISVKDAIERQATISTDITKRSTNAEKLEYFKARILDPQNPTKLFFISGETGSGKTTWAHKEFPDAPIVACSGEFQAFDLFWQPNPQDPLNPLPTEFSLCLQGKGKSDIIILDEVNMLTGSALGVIQQIGDGVKDTMQIIGGNTITVNPKLKVICTMNPDSDTDVRSALGDAVLSRSEGIVYNLTLKEKADRFGCPARFVDNLLELYNLAVEAGMVSVRKLDARLIRTYWNTEKLVDALEYYLTGQKAEDNEIFWNNYMADDTVLHLITEANELKPNTNAGNGGFNLWI